MESTEKCSHTFGSNVSCKALASVDFPVLQGPEMTIKLTLILMPADVANARACGA